MSSQVRAAVPATPAVSPEPVFYYVTGEWYKGNLPVFYDPAELPGARILEENFATIRDEVMAYFHAHGGEMKANFTPYAYRERGWKTVNLFSYFFEYGDNCRKFPKTTEIVRRIPNVSMAQVAVIDPHTRVKAHFGDTNVVIRMHLGLSVPGGLPELGLRARRQRVTWQEGKVWAFNIAHRHYAWNATDRPRVALVVDVFRDEYVARRYAIAGNCLAAIAMKAFATRYPVTKRLPRWSLPWIHRPLGLVFRAALFAQRRLGVRAERVLRPS